jgi:hypothetical protein
LAILDSLKMADETGKVNIFDTVSRLLEQRRSLISAPNQLTYLYDVVEDHILCGDTAIPVQDILPRLQVR